MTTTDPTPLAEQIAREHHLYLIDPDETETRAASAVCECDQHLDIAPGDFPERVIAAHIATVTEQALKAEWHPVLSKSAQVLDALVMDTPEDQRITDSFVDTLRSMANLTEPAHATTERAVRERVAAEIIDVRRTDGQIKGRVSSTKRYHVDQALVDAALRVLGHAHDEDAYPADWLTRYGIANGAPDE